MLAKGSRQAVVYRHTYQGLLASRSVHLLAIGLRQAGEYACREPLSTRSIDTYSPRDLGERVHNSSPRALGDQVHTCSPRAPVSSR
ncbi:hypothetical protein PCASD_01650 [Puccinia coronata f. sp. avenae]|uniref:Uncharacterized protein n=1 Tax=Puccinia coronata f. sp. avenae TaxID=200324 RepID=A0A2N5VK55_9BASI|nr:hypothetical protein PCASD_01650 [Puccinia coronata f. sp. avenae]